MLSHSFTHSFLHSPIHFMFVIQTKRRCKSSIQKLSFTITILLIILVVEYAKLINRKFYNLF